MRGEAQMTAPEVALVLGTRAALGVGAGLIMASCFESAEKRSAVGWTLLAAGGFVAACVGTELLAHPRSFTVAFGNGKENGVGAKRSRPAGEGSSGLGQRRYD